LHRALTNICRGKQRDGQSVRPKNNDGRHKAVEAYRAETKHYGKLDKGALELLDRLANSDKAVKAFERLKLKDGREREFVMLCIMVAQSARTWRSTPWWNLRRIPTRIRHASLPRQRFWTAVMVARRNP
jgi:hypothetical protein